MIFYQSAGATKNRGLVEIKDDDFLNKLKQEFNANWTTYRGLEPLICGTIVNKSST